MPSCHFRCICSFLSACPIYLVYFYLWPEQHGLICAGKFNSWATFVIHLTSKGMLVRCCAQSNKPHFSAGLFWHTHDGPAMASGSEVAHSVLTRGFLIYVLVHVEGRTLETSCLKRALGYNSMILIVQEFRVQVSIWRLLVKIIVEFFCSLKGELVYILDLYPKSNARNPAFHVSVSLDFSPTVIHSKNLCAVMLPLSNCFNFCASDAPRFLSRSHSGDK